MYNFKTCILVKDLQLTAFKCHGVKRKPDSDVNDSSWNLWYSCYG